MANKLKMRGLIDTYDSATGRGTFQLLSDYREAFEILHQRVKGAVWELTAGKWYRRRTTGWKSQNHRLNGFVSQFCDVTGNDFDDIKLFVKRKAMRRGLPPKTDHRGKIIYSKIDGEPLPISEADMDTVQCSWVIEEIQQLSAEYSVMLREENE